MCNIVQPIRAILWHKIILFTLAILHDVMSQNELTPFFIQQLQYSLMSGIVMFRLYVEEDLDFDFEDLLFVH